MVQNVIAQPIRRNWIVDVVRFVGRPVVRKLLGTEHQHAQIAVFVVFDNGQRSECFAEADAVRQNAAVVLFQLADNCENRVFLECVEFVPDLALTETVGIVRQIVGGYIGQEITKNVVEREEIQKLRAVFPIRSSDTFEYLLRHIFHFSAVCPELVKER